MWAGILVCFAHCCIPSTYNCARHKIICWVNEWTSQEFLANSYSATWSCIRHSYKRNLKDPSPIRPLSPGQFQNLEMPSPIASSSHLFKSGSNSHQVHITAALSVPSPPSLLLLHWFRLSTPLSGIYWNSSLISSLIPFRLTELELKRISFLKLQIRSPKPPA